MRVMFVSPGTTEGGAERSLCDGIEGLIRRDVACHVIIPRMGALAGNVAKLHVDCTIIRFTHWTSPKRSFARAVLHLMLNLMASFTIALKAYRWKVDVVYSNSSVTPAGAFAAFLVRTPHVWHIREIIVPGYHLSYDLGEWLTKKLIGLLSGRVIVVSEAVQRKYCRFVPACKLRVLHDGVSAPNGCGAGPIAQSLQPPLRVPTVAVIGVIHPNKGQLDAVLAVAHLHRQGHPVRLLIIGRVPERQRGYERHLRDAVAGHQLTEWVEFAGHVADRGELYRSVDIVVVCSRSEALGRVTVEAMLSHKPVIGARSGAIPELISPGVTGLLYETGNPRALASKIAYVMTHPEAVQAMTQRAFRTASQYYSVEKYAAELDALLREVAKANRSRQSALSGIPSHDAVSETRRCG